MEVLRSLVTVSLVVVPTMFGSPVVFPQHCPPLSSQGLECFDNFGDKMNCSYPTPFGGFAKCKLFYQSSTSNGVSCGHDGWAVPDFNCQILCGKVKEVTGYRPFGATIYQIVKKDFHSIICAGTLIADGFVLTSAHCVLDQRDKLLENDILLVGLGPIINETLYKVKEVEFFNGSKDKGVIEADDLAILHLVDFFLSDDVLPACLPTCRDMDTVALRDGSTGEMFGRGKEKPEKLQVKVTSNCTHFNDFCAGSSGENGVKKCPEEIGTGITIPMGDDAHIIYGILSSTGNPSCNNYRTFKRVFPFIHWLKAKTKIESPVSVTFNFPMTTTKLPTSKVAPANTERTGVDVDTLKSLDVLVTVETLTAPGKTATSSELTPTTTKISLITMTTAKPKEDDVDYEIFTAKESTFKELPLNEQNQLTNLTIVNEIIDPAVLVNSLRLAKYLTKLVIRNVSLFSGFESVEELPRIREYTFIDMHFEKYPKNFDGYFPFFINKSNSSELSEMSSKYDEINIDDGSRRFLLNPIEGILVVFKFDKIVDKILKGPTPPSISNFTWKFLILHEVALDAASVPVTLTHLHLSEVNFTGDSSFEQIVKKLPKLQILAIHNLVNREVKLECLPKDTLEKLRLDRVNLTTTDIVSQQSFTKLILFYWGIDVVVDQAIIDSFGHIFPKVRQMAFFDRDNATVIQTLLALKELELLYLRIQDIQSEEANKIMDMVTFDPRNLTMEGSIHICVEREKGKGAFKAHYLGSSTEFHEINRKFRESFDVPQCHGFDE